MTNSLLAISVAYKLAASQIMLQEANEVAKDLDLPCKKPIVAEHVKAFVGHPDLDRKGKLDFVGTITSSNFWFTFSEGKCRSVVRLNLFPNGKPYRFVDPLPYLADLAKAPLKVSTNGAYSLATNWLTRFKVNVAEVEAKYKPVVYQLEYLNEQGEQLKTAIFYVQWGPGSDGAVKVTLLGTTEELMELRLEDPALNHQPLLTVTNWRELMATSEKTLQKTSGPKNAKPPTQ
jgi:hypothetical protein